MGRYDLGFSHRPALRLSRVLEILRDTKVVEPLPSRQTLINMIERGKLDGKKIDGGYIVYEDSLRDWIKSLQPEAYAKIPE